MQRCQTAGGSVSHRDMPTAAPVRVMA
jgi:hypothetical protein